MAKRDDPAYRLPSDLSDAVKRAALSEDRSITSMVARLLREALDARAAPAEPVRPAYTPPGYPVSTAPAASGVFELQVERWSEPPLSVAEVVRAASGPCRSSAPPAASVHDRPLDTREVTSRLKPIKGEKR